MEKRKVGRPRKTSTPVVKEKKYSNWKKKHDDLAEDLRVSTMGFLEMIKNNQEIFEKQADHQLDIVKLVLDSYNTIEKHCEEAVKLTGRIEQSDIVYLTSFARRALLHKFVEFNEAEED
jgi:AmiR/NasT family two-component response regulator